MGRTLLVDPDAAAGGPVDDDGGARVEQVYATELEALRANKTNTDPRRNVRFLPYGIAVSALDTTIGDSGDDAAPAP